MARLPDDFQFSQSALQDHADCPLRFYLRYVKEMRYPAPDSEPMRAYERQMRLGERFHQLAQQHAIGIPADALTAGLSADDEEDEALSGWFDRYRAYVESDTLPAVRRAETALSVSMPYGEATRRLIARYDLLAIAPGDRAVIVDWKTAPRRPSRAYLESRWQTIVYPYVLARAGAHLFGAAIPPERISLVYWFTTAPDRPEVFQYDTAAFARAEARITAALAAIADRPDDESAFPLTSDEKHCAYCVYRSYTDRGSRAGDAIDSADGDADSSLLIDFESLDAIAF